MWTDWIPAAVVVALITGYGTIYGIRQNRKTAVETNEINASDSLRKDLFAEIERQDARLEKLDAKVQQQGQKIMHLEQREWSLRRYVYRLIDWGRSLGGEPPEPPPDLNL